MRRVWKRMTGILLAAVLLVSMGMTVSAKEISYSELSETSQLFYEGYSNPTDKVHTLDMLLDVLRTYIETGIWQAPGLSVDETSYPIAEAKKLYDYIQQSRGGTSSAEEKKTVKTASERVQDQALRQIDEALQTGSTTAVFDGKVYGINTLSRDLMGEVNRRGVDMVFKYTYNGYNYEITIPAGQAPVDPNVKWCGPMYLYSLFADTAVVTPVA